MKSRTGQVIASKKYKSFTLIELLIVVAIIGILAGVGIPMYQGYVTQAKINTTLSNHHLTVKLMRVILLDCSTKGFVTLKTQDASEKKFSCSSGADTLRKEISYHMYHSGVRNAYYPGNTGSKNFLGWMVGWSCQPVPTLGYMNLCNKSNNKITAITNIGDENGGNKVVQAEFDIP